MCNTVVLTVGNLTYGSRKVPTNHLHSLQLSHLQVVARMSNARDDSVFTVPSGGFSNNYVVCDNEAHTVVLTVQSSGLSIKVDHYASHLTKYPSQFQLPTAAELPVYVGGVKGECPAYSTFTFRRCFIYIYLLQHNVQRY